MVSARLGSEHVEGPRDEESLMADLRPAKWVSLESILFDAGTDPCQVDGCRGAFACGCQPRLRGHSAKWHLTEGRGIPAVEIFRICWQLVVNHGSGKGGVGHVKLDTSPSTVIVKNYNSIVDYYNSGYNE